MTLRGKIVQYIGRIRYRGRYPGWLFRGNACRIIAKEAHRWCIGRGIDFGAGRWPLAGATPIDMDTDLRLGHIAACTQDFVFSSHTLEHVAGWRWVLGEFARVLRPGGKIFLYLPHESMALWNAETIWGRAAGHVWTPRLETIVGWARMHGVAIRRFSSGPDAYMSWHIVLEKPPMGGFKPHQEGML